MNKQTTKERDNNKHLAALEAGVSALAIALVANGFPPAEGQDPLEAAVEAIKLCAGLGARVDELQSNLFSLAGYASGTIGRLAPDLDLAPATDEAPSDYLERLTVAAEPRILELLAERPSTETEDDRAVAKLTARVVELTAELGEVEQDLKDMTDEKNRLANEMAAANEGRANDLPKAPDGGEPAEPAPEPIVRERPEDAADVGPLVPELTSEELGVMFAASEQLGSLELAFSNGDYEIVALQRIELQPRDFVPGEGKFIVQPAVYAKLAASDVAEDVHGVGLLLGGEQVRYCSFPERIHLAPGTERRFERAISF